ncbi:hypothetical protein JTB14_028852 [Gonioctena quinquepunctata]|nr:hypothetical protein JTB14_028852 [Gonioctena quinquepunctata]
MIIEKKRTMDSPWRVSHSVETDCLQTTFGVEILPLRDGKPIPIGGLWPCEGYQNLSTPNRRGYEDKLSSMHWENPTFHPLLIEVTYKSQHQDWMERQRF